MRWIKKTGSKTGHLLFSLLLILLCGITGLLTGCDVDTEQVLLSLLETDTAYEQVEDAVSGDLWEDMTDSVENPEESASEQEISEDGSYTSPEQVALYLHLYGHLPSNYITKKEAEAAGWDSSKGNLWEVADGMSIGGSRFGNYEGELPDKDGRKWYECDVNYEGGYRGAERLIYSSDGLIYYTGDHYETFEQLY